MNEPQRAPWSAGPAELLEFALELLRRDSDASRRVAMILIDNSVEQGMRTFLSLPRRVTGIAIARRELSEVSENFPAMLDALERYAPAKMARIELGDLEWYHRLRNQLYHEGFGLSIEQSKVEIYGELARSLLESLFGETIQVRVGDGAAELGRFIQLWNRLYAALGGVATTHVLIAPSRVIDRVRLLRQADCISRDQALQIEGYQRIRNLVIHGNADHRTLLTQSLIDEMEELIKALEGLE